MRWRCLLLLHRYALHVLDGVSLLLLQLPLDGEFLSREVVQLIDGVLEGDNDKGIAVTTGPLSCGRLLLMTCLVVVVDEVCGVVWWRGKGNRCDRAILVIGLGLLFGVFQREPKTRKAREKAALSLLRLELCCYCVRGGC